ncbi:MAG: twin-arginine translocase subunit TatB [endosymbiont of Galathealinum brachiosum]|uniref:Sec-independent protein translocase protein TatB n=1 Tax=endosymbiont of Galathealinum brachiosum TaxID=2200906 RepID=A0A370DD66_9GAMM|nr:MAG: twin-arginine translocase subunit TatB [endosymbiont of Galathealinum brachiosum]
MFDVGFLEISVIMVLGLLVLGPERLPKVAKKTGYWIGKARRYMEGVKSQVEAEFDTNEVKRLLRNQEVQIQELQNKITDADQYIKSDVANQFDDDDPGNSHEEAVESKVESKPAAPQYDIIEDEFYSEATEDKTKDAMDSVMSDKAQ